MTGDKYHTSSWLICFDNSSSYQLTEYSCWSTGKVPPYSGWYCVHSTTRSAWIHTAQPQHFPQAKWSTRQEYTCMIEKRVSKLHHTRLDWSVCKFQACDRYSMSRHSPHTSDTQYGYVPYSLLYHILLIQVGLSCPQSESLLSNTIRICTHDFYWSSQYT